MVVLKRFFLFFLVNLLVVTTISLLLNLFNIRPYLGAYGLDINSLLIFSFLWGMGGAFLSLLLSRKMAKWLLGVNILSFNTQDPESKELLHMIEKLSKDAGIAMPQVGVYVSKEVNAFATGPSQKRSLVAVSTGLLEKMNKKEIQGVLAHEITHIANGDMVTMTLLQGIVNAFVMFLARALAYLVSGMGRNQKNNSYLSYMLFVFLFETIFMFFGMIVLAFFSRRREYSADMGGARLAGKENMIAALQNLRVLQEIRVPKMEHASLQALKISPNKYRGILSLISTHPPLEERIERLKLFV